MAVGISGMAASRVQKVKSGECLVVGKAESRSNCWSKGFCWGRAGSLMGKASQGHVSAVLNVKVRGLNLISRPVVFMLCILRPLKEGRLWVIPPQFNCSIATFF